MDRFTNIMLVAGIGCFVFAFLLSGLYPYLIADAKTPMTTIEELAENVDDNFTLLKDAYPVAFKQKFGEPAEKCLTDRELLGVPASDPRRAESEEAWKKAYAQALRDGRDIYIAEACWHCHSQFVRPTANEEDRYGPVLGPEHYNNGLQRPQLFGTRRVGPDLTHEGGLRSNDWHVAHLYDPRATSPGSVMPAYTWYFRDGYRVFRTIDPEIAERNELDPETRYPYPGVFDTEADAEAEMARLKADLDPSLEAEAERMFVDKAIGPDGEALSLVAYLQWLGTWEPPAAATEE